MHALTRRTARIFVRNLGAQIQKVVQNPLLLLTILAATYGIVEAVEGFVQRFGLVVVPFSLLVFAILIYFHFRDQIDIFPGRPIERKADRIVVLHNGQLVADGAPAEVMSLPIVREIYLGVSEEEAA